MGLLDDAIREHLDLKRRRGADPAELERAEREALGPVRRKGDVATVDYPGDADEPFDAEVEDAHAGSSPAAYDQAEHDDWDPRDDDVAIDEPSNSTPSRRVVRVVRPPMTTPTRTSHGDLRHASGCRGRRSDEDEHLKVESAQPPTAEDEVTRVHRSTEARAERTPLPIDDETAEHQIADPHDADARDADAHDADEDVLEETPEFLQDTPEHDRLWFEQRPPRDFDFDG